MSLAADMLSSIIFPDEIKVKVEPIQVVVSINGAEALANIEEPIRDMISADVTAAINDRINQVTGETHEGTV